MLNVTIQEHLNRHFTSAFGYQLAELSYIYGLNLEASVSRFYSKGGNLKFHHFLKHCWSGRVKYIHL